MEMVSAMDLLQRCVNCRGSRLSGRLQLMCAITILLKHSEIRHLERSFQLLCQLQLIISSPFCQKYVPYPLMPKIFK